MKRILSLFLALAIAAGCLSICAFAANVDFVDVNETDYFYDAVQWAYENGITTGKTETEFAPNDPCLREQAVMFLWRAKGCPEPASMNNPFTDVPTGSFYEKAILWAYGEGITTGATETTFAPEEACTRAHIVTFLWRANGEPEPEQSVHSFVDVADGAFYEEPVLWAYHIGVTTGATDTEFQPDANCTRAQIVTFFYRDQTSQPEVPEETTEPTEPPVEGCLDCHNKTTGQTFNGDEQYQLSRQLTSLPQTFEAVFTLSKVNHENSLLSNDDLYDNCIVYAIDTDGHPKVSFRNTAGYKQYTSYTFDQVSVVTGEKIRLSIVSDLAAGQLLCYVNGQLAQTVTGLEITGSYSMDFDLVVGGDLRNGNATYFEGVMDSLALWSDVRTADEIADGTIDTADTDLMAAYDLAKCTACMLEDQSPAGNDLTYVDLWLDAGEMEPVGEYEYAFAVLGDTQTLNRKYPAHMEAIYDWLLENREEQKIEYVIGLGDITDKSGDAEWVNANNYISKLNGNIPYILARGNHDKWADINRCFHNGYYETTLDGMMIEGDVVLSTDEATGAEETVTGDITNAYQCATIGGIDYLFLTIDFAPSDQMLNWANRVIADHPSHRVIVITHAYMYRDGTTLDSGDCFPPTYYPTSTSTCFPASYYEDPYTPNNGDDMWEKVISQHENVYMVLSGHDPWQHIVYRQDGGVNGNTVTQMLIDPQYVDLYDEPTGMVAMFYFSEGGDVLTVRYYSVSKDCYGSALSQFTLYMS